MDRIKINVIHHRSQHTPVEILNQSPVGMLGDFLLDQANISQIPIIDLDINNAICADLIIITGAMESVNDEGIQWIKKERELIDRAIEENIAMLGICFGAQHIALALGGQVARLPAPAVELTEIKLTTEGLNSPFFEYFPEKFKAVSLHQDCFTVSDMCDILAYSSNGISAFQYRNVLGLQFHPELTGDMLQALIRKRLKVSADYQTMVKQCQLLSQQIMMHEKQLKKQAKGFAQNILENIGERVYD
tara:strand:+ start:543 stop:1283 length:741 start_codon:yes stop_codon:yes gene_type:complete